MLFRSHLVGCEDAEDVVQDATAIAAKMLHSVETVGKTVTHGNIAYYAIQHVKSGRRSTGCSLLDVMGRWHSIEGHHWLISLDEPPAINEETESEIFTFNNLLLIRIMKTHPSSGTLTGLGGTEPTQSSPPRQIVCERIFTLANGEWVTCYYSSWAYECLGETDKSPSCNLWIAFFRPRADATSPFKFKVFYAVLLAQ